MVEINIKVIFISFFVLVNIVAFFMMKVDKLKAIKRKRRISERAIFLSAVFFGGVGVFMGMHVFRHKTKHWYFKAFIPLIIIVNLFLLYNILSCLS